MKELITIQSKLNVPKGQKNEFGGYKYRSAEDILEALKPLLAETNCYLLLEDKMVEVGGRVYVKATAKLINSEKEGVKATAYARESETQKGMSDAQITGSTSSYARKYAMNGLFAIDDEKDDDTRDNRQTTVKKTTEPKSYESSKNATEKQIAWLEKNKIPFNKDITFKEAYNLIKTKMPSKADEGAY